MTVCRQFFVFLSRFAVCKYLTLIELNDEVERPIYRPVVVLPTAKTLKLIK